MSVFHRKTKQLKSVILLLVVQCLVCRCKQHKMSQSIVWSGIKCPLTTTNCSQPKRKDIVSDTQFVCKIGQENEWKEFKDNPDHTVWLKDTTSTENSVQLLTEIDFQINNTSFLGIVVEIPAVSKATYVKLYSDDLADTEFRNTTRIYLYPAYNAVYLKPRYIYHCLDILGRFQTEVYTLVLRSIPGDSISYTVTYHAKFAEIGHGIYAETTNMSVWRPVLAVTAVQTGHFLHVLIESHPKVARYCVNITFINNPLASPWDRQCFEKEYRFEPVYNGTYRVHVEGILADDNNKTCCSVDQTIVVPHTFPEAPNVHDNERLNAAIFVAIIISMVTLIGLVCLLVYETIRRGVCRNSSRVNTTASLVISEKNNDMSKMLTQLADFNNLSRHPSHSYLKGTVVETDCLCSQHCRTCAVEHTECLDHGHNQEYHGNNNSPLLACQSTTRPFPCK